MKLRDRNLDGAAFRTGAGRELNELLENASKELHASIQFALIGGLAVAAWGVIRPQRVEDFLDRNGCQTEWRVSDADDPIPLLLRVNLPQIFGDIGADILWAHKPLATRSAPSECRDRSFKPAG